MFELSRKFELLLLVTIYNVFVFLCICCFQSWEGVCIARKKGGEQFVQSLKIVPIIGHAGYVFVVASDKQSRKTFQTTNKLLK